MPKISKATVDASIRANIFTELDVANKPNFCRINDRQWGIIITDDNGDERYARVGIIVAEQREDCTARELMESEIADYEAKQAAKAAKAAERSAKAERDKARREKKEKEKEGN